MTAAAECIASRTRSRTAGSASLIDAATAGDAAAVRSCLQSGVCVHSSLREGYTALHAAAASGHTKVVKLLLAAGADVAAATKQGVTALHAAAIAKRARLVAALLHAGANARAVDNQGCSPLHYFANGSSVLGLLGMSSAAASQQAEAGRLLVQHGANLEAVNAYGDTPLHCALIEKDLTAAQVLLQLGANVNAACSGGLTPLRLAVRCGHSALVRLLLSAGADVHKRCSGMSILYTALQAGDDPEMVQILLDAGADYNAPMDITASGDAGRLSHPSNALAAAAGLLRINTVRLLRKAGARSSTATGPHDALLWAIVAPSTAERSAVVKLLLADKGDAPPLEAAVMATVYMVGHVLDTPNPSGLDYDMVAHLAQYTNRMRLAASAEAVSGPFLTGGLNMLAEHLQRLPPKKHAAVQLALLKGWSADTAETDAAHAALATQQQDSAAVAAGWRMLLVQIRSAAVAALPMPLHSSRFPRKCKRPT